MLEPRGLSQLGPSRLGIEWNDGHKSEHDVRTLRLACPCAQCVDEMTGRKILDDRSVPADVKPIEISPVGRYALHIEWNDGHRTGMYTYDSLRANCACAACGAKKP